MRSRVIIALLVAVALVGVGTTAALVLLPRSSTVPEQTQEEQPADDETARETVEDRPSVPVTMAEAAARTFTTEAGLSVTAPEAFLDSDELAAVQDIISDMEDDGLAVSVVLLDLETRRGISYDARETMYPASSIKAAFCAWLFETEGGAGDLSPEAANAIVNSDNDSYLALTDAFGFSDFESWYQAVSGFAFARPREHFIYPDVTADSLASVWEEIYRFGTSGKEGADTLTSYLAQTSTSPIRDVLGERYEVWNKAGWYPTDEWDIAASNDAGLVFSDTGTYVMVIMTDASSDLDRLEPLVAALDDAHSLMCGDEVAYYEK